MKRTKLLLGVCLMALLSGCHKTTDHIPEIVRARKVAPYHVVKLGETVADVASKYNMDEEVLVKINKIDPPYTLIKGQRLIVYQNFAGKKQEQPGMDKNSPRESDGIQIKPIASDVENEKIENVPVEKSIPETQNGPDHDTNDSDDNTDETIDHDEAPETSKPIVAETTINKKAAYAWPVKGDILSAFGSQKGAKADGIDISAPVGTPVFAIGKGEVFKAQTVASLGKTVIVKHDDGKLSIYANLQSIMVQEKQKVTAKTKLGTVGKSVAKKKPALHFQVRQGKKALNPSDILG